MNHYKAPFLTLIFGGALLLGSAVAIIGFGPGDWRFWNWSEGSWLGFCTALTGLTLAFFASLSWVVQRQQAAISERQMQILYGAPLVFSMGPPAQRSLMTRNPKLFPSEVHHGTRQPIVVASGVVWMVRVLNASSIPLTVFRPTLSILQESESTIVTLTKDPEFYIVEETDHAILDDFAFNQVLVPHHHLYLAACMYGMELYPGLRLRLDITYTSSKLGNHIESITEA